VLAALAGFSLEGRQSCLGRRPELEGAVGIVDRGQEVAEDARADGSSPLFWEPERPEVRDLDRQVAEVQVTQAQRVQAPWPAVPAFPPAPAWAAIP
jgi:hypothetical protein